MRPVLCPSCYAKPDLNFKDLVIQRSLDVWKGLQTKHQLFKTQVQRWYQRYQTIQKHTMKTIKSIHKKSIHAWISFKSKLLEFVKEDNLVND